MSINSRDYMGAQKRRQDRLRRAMKARPPVQMPLPYFNRWQRLKRLALRAIRSEWFNMFVFLLMVLTAVLWSATAAVRI